MLSVYQKAFLDEAVRVQALRFGTFTLKSGRVSPYFFNAGAFHDGESLLHMARAYAYEIMAMRAEGVVFDVLFGPAYKGIPLVAAIALVLVQECGVNMPWAFNRKEAKDHGEGGVMVGAAMAGKRVLIIDDVLTAGTAVRESVRLLHVEQANPVALMVALDRQEKVSGEYSALQCLQKEVGLHARAVVTLNDVLSFVGESPAFKRYFADVQSYFERYGVSG